MATTVDITRRIAFGKRRFTIDIVCDSVESDTDIELVDSTSGLRPKLFGMDLIAFNVTKTAGSAANFTARLGKSDGFAASGPDELAALAQTTTDSKNAGTIAIDAPSGLWVRPGPASDADNEFVIQMILEG